MAKLISFGQFNKYYFLILGSIIVRLFILFINGLYPSLKTDNPVFLFGFKSIFLDHPLIKRALEYFGIGIGGLILGLISSKLNKLNKKDLLETETISINKSRLNSLLIYNDIFSKNKKSYIKKIFFVFFSFYFADLIINSLDELGFHQLKFWTFEFLALYYFLITILGKKIYNHQIVSLSITLIFTTLLYFINSFIPDSKTNCSSLKDEELIECHLLNKNIYNKIIAELNSFFIPIIIIVYLLAMILNAYASVRNKWFMDYKYITISQILSYIGIIGFLFSLILLIIFSFIPCNENNKYIENICNLKDSNNALFYDNVRLLRNIEFNNKFLTEILALLPLFLFFHFLRVYFDLLIIYYLDPFYLIPIYTCYFIIYEAIDFVITLSKTNLYNIIRFIIATSSDLISIFCCLI